PFRKSNCSLCLPANSSSKAGTDTSRWMLCPEHAGKASDLKTSLPPSKHQLAVLAPDVRWFPLKHTSLQIVLLAWSTQNRGTSDVFHTGFFPLPAKYRRAESASVRMREGPTSNCRPLSGSIFPNSCELVVRAIVSAKSVCLTSFLTTN